MKINIESPETKSDEEAEQVVQKAKKNWDLILFVSL